MGLRKRWTEERFEEWFRARFEQWINERFGAEVDERLNAWAADQFQDRFDALFGPRFDEQLKTWTDGQFPARFDSRFHQRMKAWKETELKEEFDARIEHWFDLLFTVWANTWADSADFQQRFSRHFDVLFQARLDHEVKARVANEINTLIDRRIEQWLLAVRQDLIEVEPPAPAPHDDVQRPAPPAAEPVATAAELARYLAKGPLQAQQIRKLLKGKEIPGQQPATYLLGEAASALLLRPGRRKASEHEAPSERGDVPEA